MADEEYCSDEDVYRVVPASVLTRAALLVSSVDTSADALVVDGHGLAEDDPFELALQDGGTIATPLVVGTVYYAAPVTDSDTRIQVRATPGGSAINITAAGSGLLLKPSIKPSLKQFRRAYSRWVEDRLPAHAVPLEAGIDGRYPDVVRSVVATLAAEAQLEALGQTSESLTRRADRVRRDAALMLAGLPSRDPRVTTESTNVAMGGAPSGGRWDSSGDEVVP